jgi:hypothetical protein
MRAKPDFWAKVAPGDRVETAAGEFIGEVARVGVRVALVRDPIEQRELLIPRDAFAERRGRALRLVQRPVHARGEGPERFRRRADLDDDWVYEQSDPDWVIAVEGSDPLHAVRRVTTGEPEVFDPGEGDELPTEFPNGFEAPRGDLGLGGRDRPSARQLTPAMTAGRPRAVRSVRPRRDGWPAPPLRRTLVAAAALVALAALRGIGRGLRKLGW